jgi:hypothetical protein
MSPSLYFVLFDVVVVYKTSISTVPIEINLVAFPHILGRPYIEFDWWFYLLPLILTTNFGLAACSRCARSNLRGPGRALNDELTPNGLRQRLMEKF